MTDEEKAAGSNFILAQTANNSIPYASRHDPQIAKARLTNFQTFVVAFVSTVVALLLASSVALSHPRLGRDNNQSSGSSGNTICAAVKTTEQPIIYRAIGEMRRTKEGNHLANEILAKPFASESKNWTTTAVTSQRAGEREFRTATESSSIAQN
jgi:hypothetical protein